MRITVVSSDLSQNALGRAYLFAEILARDFDVEIVGTCFGDGIWEPARQGAIPIRSVPGARWPRYAASMASLLGQLHGEVVLAVKPLVASFGVALLHRRRTGTPVVLDVDDDELAFRPPATLRRPRSLGASWGHPNGRLWAEVMARRTAAADRVTVASRGLQSRVGGILVPHAKDTDVLRPRPEWRGAARARLGVEGRRVVMFMGTPRAHKGVEDVAVAMARLPADAVFVVVGADMADPYVRGLRERFPAVVLVPPCPLGEAPFLLQAADVLIVPQRLQPESVVQMPGKLLDAMAVGKPIVATAVSDIPEVLGDGRGLVVPPADVGALAAALERLLGDPAAAARMGAAARRWCVANASYDAVQVALRGVMEEAAARRRPR